MPVAAEGFHVAVGIAAVTGVVVAVVALFALVDVLVAAEGAVVTTFVWLAGRLSRRITGLALVHVPVAAEGIHWLLRVDEDD